MLNDNLNCRDKRRCECQKCSSESCCHNRHCNPCCNMIIQGPPGKSAYEIAVEAGFVGTEVDWLESLKGERGESGPFFSCYIEALGNGQSIEQNSNIVFDINSVDNVGGCITLNDAGTTFTIDRLGLYKIEWDVNLASESAVIGIVENGQGASGAASSTSGNFSSGTLINVDVVPFTISLHNYGSSLEIENPETWENSAASIRIHRFADGPIV